MPLDHNDPTADALQRVLEGHYRLEREIGRGGMGVVFLAVDEQLERRVAIKTLPPHLTKDAAIRERFLREARTAGALSHPGIVPIYTAAERDGIVYFVMRWVDGESLADRLTTRGTLAPDFVCGLMRELAEALGYAHAHGIVHRDIKAENVLLERSTGRAIITDFGIARVAETQPLTATGTVLGTVHYMSPEQITGEALDGRSDLYALGILAFRALAGRYPFERPAPSAVLVAHVNSRPPQLSHWAPQVSPPLERVVMRLLEKDPASRYASAQALCQVLDELTQGSGNGDLVLAHSRVPASTPRHAVQAPAVIPDVLSSSDAQRVWARAAELQAHTGVVVPPPTFPAGESEKERLTRGYKVNVVRDAAVDAGIDARYVDRALEERARMEPVNVREGAAMQKQPNVFVGSQTRLEYEGSIDGELTTEGFEEIADEVRRTLGELVTISAVGRTLTITTAAAGGGRRSSTPRFLQITVASRNGRTTVHAFENLQQMAGASFGGLMGGVGGGGGALITGMVMSTVGNPVLIFPIWGSTILLAYGGARLVFGHIARKRSAELRKIVERVLAVAREHVN